MRVLEQINQQLADLVEQIRPNVVQVRNGRKSGGAGVVWGGSNGLIITNAHVVAPSLRRRRQPSVVLPNGQAHKADVIGVDSAKDLAALRVASFSAEGAAVGRSADLVTGDWVSAIGHPWGVVGAVTSGTVIALGPSPEINYPGDLVQVGLHMRPGHSGGPMINDRAEVIGINCMIAGPDVGLAIPSDTVQRFVEGISAEIKRKQRPTTTSYI